MHARATVVLVTFLGLAPAMPVLAQSADAGPEDGPGFWDELQLSAYVENSATLNLGGDGEVNALRIYDFEEDYSFNLAEVAARKPASEAHPLGFGVVVTAGRDAQKNHALGLFRDEDDVFPFEETSEVDVQEAYLAYRAPVGQGLTLKAGKFVTLLGYEVIEGPLNLNVSRSLLFGFAIPLTHVGALVSYPLGTATLTAGPVLGWDVLDDTNSEISWLGQVSLTPREGLGTILQGIVGPEQPDSDNVRWVLDLVVNWTGTERLTLGLNADLGHEGDEPSLVALGRADADATWWGLAGYAAVDWTDRLRTALRLEHFRDEDGARTLALGPGEDVALWEATATLQAAIWSGLTGRLEFRHDDADADVFDPDAEGVPTSDSQETIALALYYAFF